jgi:hypothetical protein
MNAIAARTMGINALTLPSETIFATKLKVLTLWGIPRLVQPGGLNMDADSLLQVVKPKDGNNETVKQYMLGSGMTSSGLEHRVPERLFSTPDNSVEGISTVKALQLANAQGIPIYTVTQQNIATVLPKLQLDSYVKADIQNAVNAGKVVTVSKTNINFKGWNGCGYILTNPETGAGAYLISGGLNGGLLDPKIIGAIGVAALLFFAFFFWPILIASGAFVVLLLDLNVLAWVVLGVMSGLAGVAVSQMLDNDSDFRSIGSDILKVLVEVLLFRLILLGALSWPIAIILAAILVLAYWLDSRSALNRRNLYV